MEIWLHPNRRALWLGMIVPVLGAALGAALMWAGWARTTPWEQLAVALGAVLLLLHLFLLGGLVWVMRLPRIARVHDEIWFYLAGATPEKVPLDAVEAFLSGKSASVVGRDRTAEAASIVVRIADRYPDYHERPVKPSLATWTDGYISIRGTWCEPITIDLIKSLNRRLNQAQRNRNVTAPAETPG